MRSLLLCGALCLLVGPGLCIAAPSLGKGKIGGERQTPAERRFAKFMKEFHARPNVSNSTYLYLEYRAVRIDDTNAKLDLSIAGESSSVRVATAATTSASLAAKEGQPVTTGNSFAFNSVANQLYTPSLVVPVTTVDDVVAIDVYYASRGEEPVRIYLPILAKRGDGAPSSVVNVREFSAANKLACTGSWWTMCCDGCANKGTPYCCSNNNPTIDCVHCMFSCSQCSNCAGIPAGCGGGGGCAPNCL